MAEQQQENVIDFNKICRLCLMEESVMSSIYNDQDKHSAAAPLSLKIMACVSVELNPVDGLPSQICTACLCQVDGWYKFKDLCETADTILRKCIKNEPVQIETISDVRSKAKEIKKFLASSYLMNVEGFNSVCNEITSVKEPLEIGIKKIGKIDPVIPSHYSQKCLIHVNPHAYFKRLLTECNLNEKIELRPLAKENDSKNSLESYEIAFDSHIEAKQEKKNKRKERVVMEMGDCQLLAISSSEKEESSGTFSKLEKKANDGALNDDVKVNDNFRYSNVREVLANYEKTREYLDKTLRERGNIHEEVIENVVYTYRLDEEGLVDVVNIVEGVTEPNLQRGFRYTCVFCSEIVMNKLIYDRHIRNAHLNCLVCKVCDKQLYSLRNFLVHTKTHLGVYTFTCPLCGKGLTRASIFKSHMMYHYHGKAQKCQICEKKFRDVFALRRHVQLHDKKIEFVCEICGFGTHLKSNLEYHVRSHGEEKSFMCEICGKRFGAAQNLQHHMKTHKPNYPCPQCRRIFRHKAKFINHLEQNHPELIHLIMDAEEEEEEEEGKETSEEIKVDAIAGDEFQIEYCSRSKIP